MDILHLLRHKALGFCLVFVGLLCALSLVFDAFQIFFTTTYMYPVSYLAVFLLNGIGIAAELHTSTLVAGFCDLVLGGTIYRIIHECTGIFALLIYMALVFAYPTSFYHKMQGVLLGLPAFYLYSALRLVILGVVAHFEPAWVELVHQYMMVLVNLGFLLFLWIHWLGQVVMREQDAAE